MGCTSLIKTFIAFLVSLFTVTGSNIYTVCYEDTQLGICYLYDGEAQLYQLTEDVIVPLQGNPVETYPAMTYIPSYETVDATEIMPGLYQADFSSACSLITEMITDGYKAELLFRDPSRFEMRLHDSTNDYRVIVSADDCLRLYSTKSDILDLVNTYINGGN